MPPGSGHFRRIGPFRVGYAAGALLVAGCIVAEPVPYEPPPRTPPVLDLWQALPWVGSVIPVDREEDTIKEEQDSIVLSVPVRSEDNGEGLFFALYVDYQTPNAVRLDDRRVPESTFADETREIHYTWRVRSISDGCHQLTLLVAHESSWDLNEELDSINGRGDIAMATWWINVNPPPGERYTLRNCPTVGEDVRVEQ